jgi:RNase P subunit RPR2
MKTDFKKFKLKIDLKPPAFHHNTVRKNLSQTLWKKIRLHVLEEHNYSCSICGYTPPVEELKRLHVHEIEEYAEEELLCILKGLDLICEKCHAFHHIGRTFSVLNKEQINNLKLHFIKVNNCSEDDFKEYYKAFSSKNREAAFKTMKERIAKYKETSITKEKSILDDIVLYRVEGIIPFKEEAIKQLADKGLYRFYEDED